MTNDDHPEPRWLDDDEQRVWNSFAYMLTRLPAALESRMQQDGGIAHFDYVVLSALSMAPDRTMRMSELAHFAGSALTRLSNVVIRLEKRGWVRRHPDPADGRGTFATLTDDGMAKVAAIAPAHVEAVRELIFDPLTQSQQRVVGTAARRILDAMAPTAPDP